MMAAKLKARFSIPTELYPTSNTAAILKVMLAVRPCQIFLLQSHLNSDQDYANHRQKNAALK